MLTTANLEHEATLYRTLPEQVVVCEACKLFCKLKPGRVGICGVRINREGKLYLLVYGKASAAHIDPIEKKPLYHFLPGTSIFSIGTVGCNFGCTFCQNWNISQVTRDLRKELMRADRLADIDLEITRYGYDLPPNQIVEICLDRGIPSIAYTYNEPIIFFEYLYDTIMLAREHDIHNIFVSNGYESDQALELLAPVLDAMNIDLKAFSNEFYTRICQAKLEPVLDTIRHAKELGIWVEITTLVIPCQNDSTRELTEIAKFIASVDENIPWHISAFHPDFKMLETPRTSRQSLQRAYDIGKASGLHHVYVGNILDDHRSSTYCQGCGKMLIRRSGYNIFIEPEFEKGICPVCHTKISGIWK